MRVNLFIVDQIDQSILARFENISVRRARRIRRDWERRAISDTAVIVFSSGCILLGFPPR
jgi:hypothetical protein